MLVDYNQGAISREDLKRIVANRKEEAAAYDSLMKTRRKLWKAITESDAN
ncbi:MAG: hypothetical protein ACR2IV_13535 [Bryobacteraceae bacterium]